MVLWKAQVESNNAVNFHKKKLSCGIMAETFSQSKNEVLYFVMTYTETLSGIAQIHGIW